MRFGTLSSRLTAVAVLVCALGAFAFSQEPADTAIVTVHTQGTDSGYAWMFLPRAPSNPEALKLAFETALDVILQEPHYASYPTGGWGFYSSMEMPTLDPGEVCELRIDPVPLQRALRAEGIKSLTLQVTHPESSSSVAQGMSRLEPQDEEGFDEPMTIYSAQGTTDVDVPPIVVRFAVPSSWPGDIAAAAPAEYSTDGLFASATLLGLLMVAPTVFTLVRRRRALRASEVDPPRAWFEYWHFLSAIDYAIVVAWPLALGAASRSPFGRWFEESVLASRGTALSLALVLLPPVLSLLPVYLASHAVFRRVRGLDLSRFDMLTVTLFTTAGSLALGGWLLAALAIGLESGARYGALCFIAGIAGMSLLLFARRGLLTEEAHALTSGEFRDRVFELAAHSGVKIQQLFLLAAGRFRMANALAASGNTVTVTTPLVDHLTRREMDAVLMHELAHLRLGHPQWIAIAYAVPLALIITTMLLWPVESRPSSPTGWAILFLIWLLVYLWMRRRIEYSADRRSVEWTGDPVALVSALAKLGNLNLMPSRWSRAHEVLMTHPSTERRARAILRRVPATDVDVDALLDGTGMAGPGYEAGLDLENVRLFSTPFRNRIIRRYMLGTVAAVTIVPAIAAAAAVRYPGQLGFLMHGLGFLLAVGGAIAMSNYSAVSGYRRLAEKLKAKLASGGTFVGLSPVGTHRVFEGFYDWDLGLLELRGDSLSYIGERTSFSLGRRAVVRVWRERAPGWLAPESLFLEWKTESREGALNMRAHGGGSLRAVGRDTRALELKIREWLEQPDNEHRSSPPAIGAITSHTLRETAPIQQTFALSIVCALLAAVAGALAGVRLISVDGIALVVSAALAMVVLRIPIHLGRGKAALPQRLSDYRKESPDQDGARS